MFFKYVNESSSRGKVAPMIQESSREVGSKSILQLMAQNENTDPDSNGVLAHEVTRKKSLTETELAGRGSQELICDIRDYKASFS